MKIEIKIIVLIIFSFCMNQILKSEIQLIKDKNGRIKEYYYLNENNQKHGDYKYFYKNKLQIHGYYDNGIKTGKWIYYNDSKFRIEGVYKNDKKDSIWDYHKDNVLMASIDYISNKYYIRWGHCVKLENVFTVNHIYFLNFR